MYRRKNSKWQNPPLFPGLKMLGMYLLGEIQFGIDPTVV
jgi:hypothetical protein